jgi:hypothetical protein
MFYVVIGEPGEAASLGPIRRAAVFIMRPDQGLRQEVAKAQP